MKPFFPLLLSFPLILCAHLEFSSQHVKSNGDEMVLTGNVHIQHALGILKAHEAHLQQDPSHGANALLSATLKSNVELLLSSHQSLTCEEAHIDFLHHAATLTSHHRAILYSDPAQHMTLRGHTFECEWEDQHHKPTLTSLRALNQVDLNFGDNLHLLAKQATLSRSSSSTLDTLKLLKPFGTLRTTEEKISFDAGQLTFDHTQGELVLQKDISMEGPLFGKLTSSGNLTLYTENQKEGLFFHKFKTSGPTRFCALSGIELECDGTIDYNPNKRILQAEQGASALRFIKNDLTIESEHLSLTHEHQTPEEIIFTGQVTLLAGEMKGIATRLLYQPNDHILHLQGTQENPVTFTQANSSFILTAEGVRLAIDELTQEKVVHGEGVVKITFDHTQREQLTEAIHSCTNPSY